MSNLSWQHIRRRRLSRRQLLNASARMGVGAAGLALVGCGGDDDEEEEIAAQVTPAVEEQAAEQAVAEQVAEQVVEEEAVAQTQVEEMTDPVAEILDVKMSDAAKLKIFRTTDIELDPIVESAYARSDISIFEANKDLLIDGWRSGTLETGRGNVRIGFAEGTGQNTYRLQLVMELMMQAFTYPEVASVQWTSALGDTTKALSDMQAFTAQGVDIIIGHFDIGETALQVVKDATAEGIIVVNEYFDLGGEPGVDYVGLANAELCDMGVEMASSLLAEYEAAGNTDPNYFLLGGTPGNTFTEAWETCADPVMEAAGATKLGRSDTGWTVQGTFEAAAASLARESRIDGWLHDFAFGFQGVTRAYEATGRALDFTGVVNTDEVGPILTFSEIEAANPGFKMIYGNSLVNIPRLAMHMAMLKHRGMENVPTLVLVPFKNFPAPPAADLNPLLPGDASLTSSIPDDYLIEMFGRGDEEES